VPLIILGTAVVLVGAGLGIAFIVQNVPADLSDSINLSDLTGDLGIGGRIDCTYMPSGTTRIVRFRPRALWDAEFVEPNRVSDEGQARLARFEGQFGIPYAGVDTVTIFRGASTGDVHVVELAEKIDIGSFIARIPGAEAVARGSATYYRLGGEPTGKSLHFVTTTTIIVAPEEIVSAVIDGSFIAGDASTFAFVDGDLDFLYATTDGARTGAPEFLDKMPRQFHELHGAWITGSSGGARLTGRPEIRLIFRFGNEDSAEHARVWFVEGRDQAREAALASGTEQQVAEIDASVVSRSGAVLTRISHQIEATRLLIRT
jgi:hypothetical protein